MPETTREAFEKLVKDDPRFVEAPRSNQAMAITGVDRRAVLMMYRTPAGRVTATAGRLATMPNRNALKLRAGIAAQHCVETEDLSRPKIEESSFVGRDKVCDR